MENNEAIDLIIRCATGKPLEGDNEKLETWLKSAPENKKLYDAYSRIWKNQGNQNNWDTENEWNKLNAALIQLHENETPEFLKWQNKKGDVDVYEESEKRSSYKMLFVRIAAVIVIFIGGYYTFQFSGLLKKQNIENIWDEQITAAGTKLKIRLTDGSFITLNNGSKIKYKKDFNVKQREIYLEGEAYFEVSHNKDKKFVVHTGNISTTVLGTKFNVNAFPQESKIAVSLVEGKVNVSKEEKGSENSLAVLKPSQQLVFNKTDNISVVENFNAMEVIGWLDNSLIFKKERLPDVLAKLEKVFGVKFELADKSFDKFRITGDFTNNSYITITKALQKLTGLSYKTIKENNETKKIVLYKK